MSEEPINFTRPTLLGRTGLSVSRMGLAAGYKLPAASTVRAFREFGVNYFYYETRKPGMREGLREILVDHREEIVLAVQTYDRTGFLLERSVDQARRHLGVDRVEILFLGWYAKLPGRRVMDAARRLVDKGIVGCLGVTGHDRGFHGRLMADAASPFDVQMIRYNAAHRGAETEVFDLADPEKRPGICVYTATRWGKLLSPRHMPRGERPLTAAECYRFVLGHPRVDICLSGPRNDREMEEGLRALREGPLSSQELARVIAIGDHVHG